jgi:subtilisin-like proprotein convertase family protein
MIGNITKATVTLNGLSHTFPQDLDILLTGPAGQNVMLMSDVGGGNPGVAGITMTFDDDAPAAVPGAVNPGSGTYKPTNDDSAGLDALPGPSPVAPYGAALSVLGGANPNGVWSLFVFDAFGGDVGALAAGWSVTLTTVLRGTGFCNFAPITIPAGAPGVTLGAASLYPSNISVPPLPGEMDQYKVRVDLLGLTHSYPDDLDILLVGPGGQSVVLMSDAAGFGPGVTNVTFSFDDDATAQLPDGTNPPGGSYKPTDVFDGPDPFPAPAPAPPYGRSMASFKGANSSGTWSLYIVDDALSDVGSLASGWCVEFLPSITAAEVPNLRWRNDTILQWGGPNATSYNLYRGDPPVIRFLQDPTVDSCLRGTSLVQEITGLVETPIVGSWHWYLLRGNNAQGEGHPGFMLLGTQLLARIQDSSGSCP